MSLDPLDFDYICKLVKEQSAIALEPSKNYLVSSRLEPLAAKEGFQTIGEMVSQLRTGNRNGLQYRVVEAMTTNETSFFRDLHPFEALRKTILPALIASAKGNRPIQIWCAASSSGQEPYSLCMLIRESFPSLSAPGALRIMASDLSREMVERCRKGIFSQLEVNRGLPIQLLTRHFKKIGSDWKLNEDVCRMVDFQEINLANSWPTMPMWDLVMVRNVMIYFDTDTKKQILEKIRQRLRPDGYLILGGAETTINLDDRYERMAMEGTSVYRVKQS